LLIDDEMVDANLFSQAMKDKIQSHPNAVITIKADAKLKAHTLIRLLEDIKHAGGKNLSLMTQSFT
jgi:biopolymer transport protein ExbD